MKVDPAIAAALAPAGRLRVALNLGNVVLVHREAASGEPAGVSVDLSRRVAADLGVPVEFACFGTAAESLAALLDGAVDLAFMAIDPGRAQGVHFTPPYLQIEGSYAVPVDSPIRRNEDVDAAAHEVVVGAGSAYDLFLSRHLRHARIVRVPLSEQVVHAMLEEGRAVAAGVRQQLEILLAGTAGVRLLDGSFMVIHQAVAVPARVEASARGWLDAAIEQAKASGLVAEALARHGVDGVRIAPPGRHFEETKR